MVDFDADKKMGPRKTFECKICGSIIKMDKETEFEKVTCSCGSKNFVLLATEYTDDEFEKINLKNLYRIYKENLYIEDTDRIDVILATALSKKLEGIPLWLILVGASGDMKSVQLNALENDDTYILHNLTSKTLVNGYKDKDKFPDLAPELDGKLVIIPDMAQILKLPPVDKAEVWAQLRDLYDGVAGKTSGLGSRAKYKNLKVTLLAGSTPSIDSQILVHQDLGTRELVYRTSGNKEKEKVMQQCFDNEEREEEIKKTLRKATKDFLNKIQVVRTGIPSEIVEEIKIISTFVTYMRATAEFDNYTHELRNYVYPEEPTRIAKQLKRMYLCLKSLDEDYPEIKAVRILWHIAKSSAFPVRIRLFELLRHAEGELSTSQVSEILKIGKSTAKRECAVLHNIGILDCRKKETSYPDRFYEYWSFIKENPIKESQFVYQLEEKEAIKKRPYL